MRASKSIVGAVLVAILLLLYFIREQDIASSVMSLSSATTMPRSLRAPAALANRQATPKDEPPIHVLFGLSGSHPGFLAEFETALKSIVLNAPIRRDLHVHVLADDEAHCALGGANGVLNRTGLDGSLWLKQMTMRTYNVQPYIPEWTKTIVETMRYSRISPVDTRHTIGCFFRLFAHDVLPDDVHHFLYLDTDAVVLANLGDLWTHLQPDALFHWGDDYCSGFVLINAKRLPDLWEYAKRCDVPQIREETRETADQLILRSVNMTYPKEVAMIPNEWATSIANGAWKFAKDAVERRPELGMIHYNGGGASKEAYFEDYQMMRDYPNTWGLPIYYAHVPWTWARYQGYSKIGGGEGMAFQIVHDWNASEAACIEVAPFTKRPTVEPTKAPVSKPPTEAPTQAPIKVPLASGGGADSTTATERAEAAKKPEEGAGAALAAAKAEASKNVEERDAAKAKAAAEGEEAEAATKDEEDAAAAKKAAAESKEANKIEEEAEEDTKDAAKTEETEAEASKAAAPEDASAALKSDER